MSWLDELKLGHPCWDDFRDALISLDGDGFPDVSRLNSRLGITARSGGQQAIRFVADTGSAGLDYESRVYQSGEVSTRENSWHDLFNALCWQAWPQLKSAMNLRHHQSIVKSPGQNRSSSRDALTLFDECGAVLVSPYRSELQRVSDHAWSAVFDGGKESWDARYRIFIAGHAMLEKHLQPYKSMTANTLLIEVAEEAFSLPRAELRFSLDEQLASMIAGPFRLLSDTSELSPLPLAGVPAWWDQGPQDHVFYDDESVFRPSSAKADHDRILLIDR